MREGVQVATRVGTPAEYTTFGFVLGVVATLVVCGLVVVVVQHMMRR